MDATAAALPVLVQGKGKKKTPRGPPLAWRLGVSLAAVALTWATSLRVAISVAGAFVVVPPGSLVRDTCSTLRDATTHAEAVYGDCVDAQSKQCDRHYDDVLLDVETMLRDKQMRNEATLSTYREIYETCASHANALMGHATYKNASFKAPSDHFEASLPPSSWTASCKDASKLTGADVLEAQAARSEDAAAFATVIIQCPSELLFDVNTQESASTMNALTRYAEARARYDTTYIRGVYASVEAASSQFKISTNATWPGVATALGDVRACLSIDANTTCKITPDARDAFGDYASRVQLQVAMASDVVEAFSSEAHAYQQRVEDAFDSMTAFYDAFHTWYARLNVIEIDPPGALLDAGLEDFYAYPGAWPDGLTLLTFPSANELYPASLSSFYDDVLANVSLLYADAAVVMKRTSLDLREDLQRAFAGYDPPSITDYVDAPSLKNASDAYAEKAEAFANASLRVVDYDVDLLTTMDVRNASTTTTSTLIGTARDRLLGWAELETDVDVSATFAQIARSASLIILLDYAWRVASSLRTVKKFLDKSAVQLPKARVRAVSDSDKGFYAAVGWVVASPYPSLALVGAMGAAIFVGAARAYAPLFAAYAETCVRGHGTLNNGTVVARNLYAVSYNAASSDGRAAQANFLDAYDARRAEACAFARRVEINQSLATSDARVRSDEAERLRVLVDAQDAAASRFSLLNACVDEPLNSTECRHETWALDSNPFDCASLPICDITCGGPSVQVLRTAAQHCACSAEWWLHATILRLGAALVIFLVLQISRTWVVDGLCRLNWRRLTDAVFAYEASCDIDGNPTVEGDVRAHVRADLQRRLRAWLCVGRLKVMGAVLVHAAWVAPLARLRRDVAYAPH